MSLAWTLASRNLFNDRLRFIATTIGIVFSVVLVIIEVGLYVGFSRTVTTMITHADADLWVVAKGANSFEDLTPLNSDLQNRIKGITGVADVAPIVIGFASWRLSDGTMTPVFVVGSDLQEGNLRPWNVRAGSVSDLNAANAVGVDEFYQKRLGVQDGLGATGTIDNQPAKVALVTSGIRSFTTTPYVFTTLDRARRYIGMPDRQTSHFLVRLRPGANPQQVRSAIASDIAGIDVLTPAEFSQRSRSFWLIGTGAGAALFGGALLGVIVGIVIVAQTLYASTKDNLPQFATLRAMGSSKRYIYRVVIGQAVLSAIIGFLIAALIGIVTVYATATTALPITMTPGWTFATFVLTLIMCLISAVAAIVPIMRVDPVVAFSK